MAKVPNMNQLMKMAQDMSKQMEDKMNAIEVEGNAGGGMVKATANGKKEIISIEIDNEVISSGDKEMIEDLVVAAVNKALESANKMAEEEMASVTKGMMPPGLNIPGL